MAHSSLTTNSRTVLMQDYVIFRRKTELRVGAKPISGSTGTVLLFRVCAQVSKSVAKWSAADWEWYVSMTEYLLSEVGIANWD